MLTAIRALGDTLADIDAVCEVDSVMEGEIVKLGVTDGLMVGVGVTVIEAERLVDGDELDELSSNERKSHFVKYCAN